VNYLLGNLACHVPVVSHLLVLVAEFFLDFFEAHLHLLQLGLMDYLHLTLGFVRFDTA